MKRIALWTLVGLVSAASLGRAQPLQSIAERTAGLQRSDGYIPFYWDAGTGRLLLEIVRFDEDVLYYVSIGQAVGSVELGMDRGIEAQTVIHFQRVGPRVHVVQQNLDYRAGGSSAALAQNVADSFATSVLASLPVEAEEGGRVLVDATPLVIRDGANIEGDLRRRDQGTFRLDASRSAIYPPRTKAFPENTEVEVIVTYAGDNPGQLVSDIAPDGRSLSVRLHHSFLKPPEGYRTRVADPRIGVGSITYKDYSMRFDRDPEVRLVRRWRLEKQNPGAALSEPRKPIVFYFDPAIPEPTRSAMKQGALWWNRAYEAAGFQNAVRAEDAPPDMDPMDIRYAYVLWINRDERGFSSGGTFADPRTGEIIGSKTRMDSHRIRTIGHYWQGYQPTDGGAGDDDCGMILPSYEFFAEAQRQDEGVASGASEMILARQAVLTAHELGHVQGFGHNWNSSMNDRASVMEYPTPRVSVTADGRIDLSDAFEEGVGAYDEFMARYAYSEFSPEEEEAGLEAIIGEMRSQGILYTPSTDPRWSWYDDLSSPTEYLRETMAARAIMLQQYGPAILAPGEPIGQLRDMRLWMVYLHHRWAIESGLKHIGGMYHNYVVKGDDLPPTEVVPAALQREILSLMMDAIQPGALAMPESLLAQLTVDPYRNREDMSAGYVFDHLRAARILSALVIGEMLTPDRAARLVALADRHPDSVTLPEVLDAILQNTWNAARDGDSRHRSLRRVTQQVALDSLMILGAHADTTPEARAVVLDRLSRVQADLAERHDDDPVGEAHIRQAERDVERYLDDPEGVAPESAAPGWGGRPRSRYPLAPGPPLGGGPLR